MLEWSTFGRKGANTWRKWQSQDRSHSRLISRTWRRPIQRATSSLYEDLIKTCTRRLSEISGLTTTWRRHALNMEGVTHSFHSRRPRSRIKTTSQLKTDGVTTLKWRRPIDDLDKTKPYNGDLTASHAKGDAVAIVNLYIEFDFSVF